MNFCSFSSLLPVIHEAAVLPSATVAKICVSFIRMSSSPKVLDVDGVDSLMWTGPQ